MEKVGYNKFKQKNEVSDSGVADQINKLKQNYVEKKRKSGE